MAAVLDMAVVEELLDLTDDGDVELLVDLIGMFLDDSPGRVTDVLEGLQANDLDRVERAAHSLRSSAGNLGASEVQRLSGELQLASREPRRETIERLAVELRGSYAEAEVALRELLGKYTD